MKPALAAIIAQFALSAIPEIPALIVAIEGLFKGHPGLTEAQIVALCQAIAADVNTTTNATDAALDAELNKPKV